MGPDAWAYHHALETGQVDTVRAYRVRKDIRLVAADVLSAAGAVASAAASQGEQVKRFKVEGQYEEEYFAPANDLAQKAQRWYEGAERYRVEVAEAAARQAASANPAPVLESWDVAP